MIGLLLIFNVANQPQFRVVPQPSVQFSVTGYLLKPFYHQRFEHTHWFPRRPPRAFPMISFLYNSLNVIKAFQVAKEMGMKTVGITGKNGGEIAKIVDYSLNVASDSTPRIQEVHITIGHIICEMVDYLLFPTEDI